MAVGMHGLVFQEFLDFAEDATSAGFVRDMLTAIAPPSGGRYHASGRYDHAELEAMIEHICRRTGEDRTTMLREFGRKLFGTFATLHSDLFRDQTEALDFLERIEDHIHTEIRKIDPQNAPPYFTCERLASDKLVMRYRSHRPYAALCVGLIEAALQHFALPGEISIEDATPDGRRATFVIAA